MPTWTRLLSKPGPKIPGVIGFQLLATPVLSRTPTDWVQSRVRPGATRGSAQLDISIKAGWRNHLLARKVISIWPDIRYFRIVSSASRHSFGASVLTLASPWAAGMSDRVRGAEYDFHHWVDFQGTVLCTPQQKALIFQLYLVSCRTRISSRSHRAGLTHASWF
ncbi:hypothetical protein F5Y15DRAFT_370901 [Xylariaceae sp. FL0016]|nr:hypothetical protein F5Y15DRAFT_370901 [Xylariaceae sp. FL0016]